jgi:hypothetical protein
MKDQIYPFDRDAFVAAANKRGWNAATLAKFSGIHLGTIRRLLGEAYPKDMGSARRDKIRGMTAIKLAFALRTRPQDFAPDLPERPPQKNPPEPPPDPRKSELADWRSRRQMADVRQKRWQASLDAALREYEG